MAFKELLVSVLSIRTTVDTVIIIWVVREFSQYVNFYKEYLLIYALVIHECSLIMSMQEAEYSGLAKLGGCMRTDKTVQNTVEHINLEKLNCSDYDERLQEK